jgi:hypothetical protein
MYSKMIDNYFLHVLDIGNNDNFSELIKGVE